MADLCRGMFGGAVAAGVCLSAALAATPGETNAWAVYYAGSAPPAAFRPYSLVVLDNDTHPPILPLKEMGKTVLGYLSVGEVEAHRSYFSAVRSEGILLGANRVWDEGLYVDVRDPRWCRRIVEEIIPSILRKGFDGVFLDTVDNASELEDQRPKTYAGMRDAMVRLIKAIRSHFPSMIIMVNRGYDMLPMMAGSVDIAMAEGLYSDYDFGARRCRIVPQDQYEERVRLLRSVQRRHPSLKLYALDYWDPADREGVARIYREERAHGMNPYVATVDLDILVPEPRL